MASPATLSDLPDRTDVLVVGAGPAGLTMAVSLVQLGVDCVVIDRKPAVAAGSKAAAAQPRAYPGGRGGDAASGDPRPIDAPNGGRRHGAARAAVA